MGISSDERDTNLKLVSEGKETKTRIQNYNKGRYSFAEFMGVAKYTSHIHYHRVTVHLHTGI